MPDIWYDVDAALAEVPVNKFPLIDDTDFKTRETGVAYNAAGMNLVWNFVTSAGAYTQTAVTPTTGGAYDWAHQGDAMYTIEMPASGGASINNDTEGYGWFTGICDGVLAWASPIFGFRAAAINDALCDGGDQLDVNVDSFAGSSLSGNGPFPHLGIVDIGTAQSFDGTDNKLRLRAGFSSPDITGCVIWVYSSTNGLHTRGVVTAWDNTNKDATIDEPVQDPSGTILYVLMASPLSSENAPVATDVKKINGTTVIGDGSSGNKFRGNP